MYQTNLRSALRTGKPDYNVSKFKKAKLWIKNDPIFFMYVTDNGEIILRLFINLN